MEEYMTDYQYRTVLKSINLILDGCETISEAKEKITLLLEKDDVKKERKLQDEE